MNSRASSLILTPPSPGVNEEFSRTLLGILSEVTAWVKSQKTRVSEGYLVPEPAGLRLYVIGRAEAFDFDLGGELSDFSVRLFDQGIYLDTMLLGSATLDELTAFFDPVNGPAIHIPAE